MTVQEIKDQIKRRQAHEAALKALAAKVKNHRADNKAKIAELRASMTAAKEAEAKAAKEAKEKAAQDKARAKAEAKKNSGKKKEEQPKQKTSNNAGNGNLHFAVMHDLAANYGLRSNMTDKDYSSILRKYMAANHPDKFAQEGKAKVDLQTALCQWASNIIEAFRKQSYNCNQQRRAA